MDVRSEIHLRAKHIGRLVRAGLPPLWAISIACLAVVGGSVIILVIWGVKHVFWGVIVALALMIVVIMEGSYREFRRLDVSHKAELTAERKVREDTSKAQLQSLPNQGGSLASRSLSAMSPNLTISIERQRRHLVGDKAIVLEIDYSVRNNTDKARGVTPAGLEGPLCFPPHDDLQDMEVMRIVHDIEESRSRDRLPTEVQGHETIRGVYVAAFRPNGRLRYALKVKDDFDRTYVGAPPFFN